MKIPKFGLSVACILSSNLVFADLPEFSWVGIRAGGAANWSIANNWEGPQGQSPGAPSGSGRTLSFEIGQTQVTTNDISGLTLQSIFVEGGFNPDSFSQPYSLIGGVGTPITMVDQGLITVGNFIQGDKPLITFQNLLLTGTVNVVLRADDSMGDLGANVLFTKIDGGNLNLTGGTGTIFTLGGPNTYANTMIGGGSFVCGSANAFPTTSGAIATFNSSTVLNLNGYTQNIQQLNLDNTCSISSSSSASLIIGSDNSSSTITGSIGQTNDLTALVKAGSGTLTLSSLASLYQGGTTLNAGTLSIAGQGSLGVGSLTMNGGTLIPSASFNSLSNSILVNGNSTITANAGINLGFAGTLVGFNTSTLTLTPGGGTYSFGPVQVRPGITFTVDGVLSGTQNLSKSDTGILVLKQANSYSGGTSITAGTLALVTPQSAGTGLITFTSGASGNPTSLRVVTASKTIANSIALASDNAQIDTNGFDLTLSGILSGNLGSLQKVGAGTLTLSNTGNNYTGRTTVTTGTLLTGAGSVIPSTSLVVLASGTTLNLNGTAQVVGNLSGPSGSSVVFGGGALTVGDTIPQTTFAGILSSVSGGTLTKIGTGELVLTGANTYKNGTNLNGGTLSISSETGINAGTGSTFPVNFSGGTLNSIGNVTLAQGVPVGILSSSTLTTQSGFTTQVNGTLTGANGTSLTLGGSGTNSVGSVSVASGTTFTISGVIGGSQTLTKIGSGILNLDSANSYASTSLSQGTINLTTSVAKLGTGTLTLSDGTTLTSSVDGVSLSNSIALVGTPIVNVPVGTLNLAGNFSGGTQLTKSGSGILNLSGQFTTSPQIDVSSGTLQISRSGSSLGTGVLNLADVTTLLSTVDGVFVDNQIVLNTNPTISVNTGTTTLTNTLSGGTRLTKSGSGTLNVSGQFISSPEIFVSSGTFQVSRAGSSLGNGVLNLADGTTFLSSVDGSIVDNPIVLNGNSTISVSAGTTKLTNDFSGGSLLKKVGAGTLRLDGTTSATPNVSILAGNLAVVGGMLTSNVTVGSGGTLSGTGIVTGTVINNGNIAPGASIGTLTIAGNYTQANGSTFSNEIDETSSDQLIVQGNVVIGNNTSFNVIAPLGFTYPAHDYTVITTAGYGTVSGQHFRRLNISDPAVGGLLSYLNDQVILTIYEGSIFPEGIFKGNPGKVEQALETLFFEGDMSLEEIYFTAIPLTSSQLYNALDYMHPAMYKGMTLAQQNAAVLVQNSLNHRFQNVLDERRCFTCLDQSQKRETFFWGTGFGELLRQSEAYTYDSPQAGYCDDAAGFVGGLDHQFLDTFYVGALGGYSHSHLSWTGDRGKGNINSGYAGLYASAIGDLFYGNLAVTGAWSGFAANRNIIYPGINQTAQNTHHGKQILSHFDTGLNFAFNKVTVRPFDGLDWIVQQESAYTETGAGPFDLEISSSVANMLRNELGVNFASCGYLRRAKIVADAKLSWVYEARLKGKESDCRFQGTDVPFTVIGYFPTRNLFSVGGSLTTTLLDEFVFCTALKNGEFDHKYAVREDVLTFTLYYNGVFGDKYQDNSFGGQFNLGF